MNARSADPDRIRALTVVTSPPLCPEIRLHLATAGCDLWRAAPAELDERFGVEEPYWAFCWGGGQALARHLLDHPRLVRGRRVLDVGPGGGVEAVAAALAGAAGVRAVDVDPWATAAVGLNAALNGVSIEARTGDPLAAPAGDWDVLLAADLCYDPAMARRLLAWLAEPAGRGALALVSDLDRGFLPRAGLECVARYRAPADNDVGGRHLRPATVYRVA